MPKESAGILLYRRRAGVLEVLLVHPGGPFYANRDNGVWSIPKGEIDEGEDALTAAQREFTEETGFRAASPFLPLAPVKQRSGKVVRAWAAEGDCDPREMKSTTFTMEWPPRSGKQQEFPEADRAAWFSIGEAKEKIISAQTGFLEELQAVSSFRLP